jgi:linoleoyl-CoA desaturase
MDSEKLQIVRFAPKGEHSFYDTVIAKVRTYFAANHISPYANREMWLKTIFMLLLFFGPYVLVVTGVGSASLWLFLGFWFLMGLGKTGIGTSVMHDANHGSYSSSKKVNNGISYILEVIGGYTVTWRIQHNVLHHTYTNVQGLDEDIDTMRLIRLSPTQPNRWYYRYQHIYAWFFYMIMTLYWMTAKDYLAAFRYRKHGLLVKQKTPFGMTIFRMTLYKLFYYAYILVLPILFSGMPWYWVLAGFLLMHFTAGLFLSCIFQPAHIMETSAFALPVEKGGKKRMEDSWAVHEVMNTANFAPRSRILSWFIGGLNYQIEHHLFTGVCHVHYKKIAAIVKSTIEDFGLPYHVQPTFLKALWVHAKMLKRLGRDLGNPVAS